MQAFPTKDDQKIEQHRGFLGVVLVRKKDGFQGLCSGSVVNLVQSEHFPSGKNSKEGKVVKCLSTSSDVFPDGDSCRIDNYVIDYWDLNCKYGYRLQLADVAQTIRFFRPTPGLALIPVQPTKVASVLSICNWKSSVFDDRRTFHTGYYCNEDGESETRTQIRCFIAGSPDSRTDSFNAKSFTLISTKDEQGELRYELQDEDDQTILKTYCEIKTRNLYPRGAPIFKFKPEHEGKEAQVTYVYIQVGTLSFSSDDKKEISPVFFTQETLTGQVQLYFPTSDQASAGATSIGCAQGSTAVPKKGESCKLGQGEDFETHLARNARVHGYRIREVDIPSDGNCLFHAVVDQLKVLGVPGQTHESLRNLAVQELRSNMDDNHLSMDLGEIVENNNASKYIQRMSVDGEWGGHPELVALSHALQKTIKVVSSTSEAGNAIQDIGSFGGLPILLGYEHQHYRSLEQVKKDVGQGQGEDCETHLARNARAHGYRIREVDIPSDGNCLFHAVVDQLKVLGVPGHTHESLRNLAVQELRSNMDDNHLSMDLGEIVENNDASKYIQRMSVDGEWGGHPELVALSHALQKTIKVVSSTSKAGNAIQDIGSFGGLPILLGYEHQHYRSLEQVKKDVGQDTLTVGPNESPPASLPRNGRSVVTGRSNHPPPQNLADIPGEESGRPSHNYDVITSINDYSWSQKEEHLKNINFLTTRLRKVYAELHKVQRQPEEDPQEVKRLKEKISEENEGLRIDHSAVCIEIRALRTENSALRSKVNSQNICAVCGNDSQSSTESTAAKLSSPRRSDSSGSSEEEYVDALSEPGAFILE